MNEAKIRSFVISPIGHERSHTRKHADAVFKRIITPAVEKGVDFAPPVRSDHLGKPGKILEQIIEHIANDDLCIAVLTDQNANVLYEVGIAHTLGKPLVLLIDDKQRLPSDLGGVRTVMYNLAKPERSVVELVSHIKYFETENWTGQIVVREAIPLRRPKYDVFISVPMTSMRSKYNELRPIVSSLAEELKKDPGCDRVYSAALRIGRIKEVEPPAISALKDLEALDSSKYFILLYPARVASSSLVETGYALAMRKPSVYLFRKNDDLPFMLQELAQKSSRVKTFRYDDERDLQKKVPHILTMLSNMSLREAYE